MRLGIFGGSFDPPHIGHLLAAVDALEAMELDRIVFVPASLQPLKSAGASAPSTLRLEMVRLLVAGDARFDVDAVELERGGLSYTIDTLNAFARRFPKADRFFLVGTDALETFGSWREPERILEVAHLIVLRRPGFVAEPAQIPQGATALVTRQVDVSSTEIRERIRAGKSIRGFVPDPVAQFIDAKRLYR